MEDLKEIKKKVASDWENALQQLTIYSQNKFYKIVGPMIIGVEAVNIPAIKGYRPHFVVYPLWEMDIKGCLDTPLVYRYISTKKGLQFDIPYLMHTTYFQEALDCVQKQVLLPFNRDFSLEMLFQMIDAQNDNILVSSSPVVQADHLKLKLFSALYVNDVITINKILDEIKQASEKWLPNLFEWRFGSFDTWFQSLQDKVNRREEFLERIAHNKQDKKLEKLRCSELVV